MIRVLGLLAMALPLVTRAQQQPPQQAPPQSQRPPQGVEPRADGLLREMGETLRAAKSLSFTGHAIIDQVMPDGQKVQYAKNQKVWLRRPDRLAADVVGDVDEFQFRYNGKEVGLYSERTNSWGAAPAPALIENTLDMLAQQYGLVVPLADLAFPDPYKCLIEQVRQGQYIGTGYVVGDPKCHHLAFRQASVDWQIWIEQGDKPLPRKVVITFKDSPALPQYTAFLADWNLAPQLDDATFELKPPASAKKAEFAPATQPSAGGANK